MIKVIFKNVGQGDSILLEWEKQSVNHFGVIDCNLYDNRNPLLEETISKGVKHIDFIILSHLHFDHYSGLSELLDYCIKNSITIGIFLHTFTTDYSHILDLMHLSKKKEKNTEALLENIQIAIDKKIIKEIDDVSNNFAPINLYSSVNLSFLAPFGNDYFKLSKQRSNYEHKLSTACPDFNIMSTIITIANEKESILLTSDATKLSLKRIIQKITTTINIAQVPHHGSSKNLVEPFWKKLNKISQCPAIFSVGDVKKDKLPNKEVVEFFEAEGFDNQSTNFVYGIVEYYTPAPVSTLSPKGSITSLSLSTFSKLKSSTSTVTSPLNFSGDKTFVLNL